MARMTAAEAAVKVMEREGITNVFGLPVAAINPTYAALWNAGTINHTLARHMEAASHMAEGYTRAEPGNIGVCIGTSGPAGTDMITGLYSAAADSIPILCITGQAPVSKLHKEDFQAINIADIAGSVTKWAITVLEPAQVPRAFQKAFQLMLSHCPGPVLIDLPTDVQMAEIDFDIETYEPLPSNKPAATRAQAEKALDMMMASGQPLIVAGGGIINAGQAGPLGWTMCAALGVKVANPEHQVPVVVEVILERVTDIAMGTEIDAINEFEATLDLYEAKFELTGS